MRAGPELSVLASAADVADAAADLFVELARSSIERRGRFVVALAGGTTPAEMHRRLATAPRRDAVDWSRVHVFFGDERGVPPGDPERNDRGAREALLDHVPIPPLQIHPIPAERADGDVRYQQELRDTYDSFRIAGGERRRYPRLDLIVLGMGPDGHTASLFPGHELPDPDLWAQRVTDSPKPPAVRVTLTLPLINAAEAVAFVVTGAEKAPALAGVLHGDTALPAARVAPTHGRLVVLSDRAAYGG